MLLSSHNTNRAGSGHAGDFTGTSGCGMSYSVQYRNSYQGKRPIAVSVANRHDTQWYGFSRSGFSEAQKVRALLEVIG